MRRFIVRILSRKKIRVAAWYKVTKSAKWKHFADVRQSWKNSDNVGTCVVFDISNSRCRLIAYIRYDYEKVFILHILSHSDYDKNGWRNDCDCD
jgi:mRNA interferase HigB